MKGHVPSINASTLPAGVSSASPGFAVASPTPSVPRNAGAAILGARGPGPSDAESGVGDRVPLRPLRCAAVIALLAAATAVPRLESSELGLFQGPPKDIVAEDASVSEKTASSGSVLRVSTGRRRPWPGVILRAPNGSWNLADFGEVDVELRNAGAQPVRVHCRIDNPGADGTRHCVGDSLQLPVGGSGILKVALKRASDDRLDGKLFGMRGYPVAAGGPGTVEATNLTQILLFVDHPTAEHQFDVGRITATGVYRSPTASVTDAAPYFPFIDTFGQYMHRDWPGKAHSIEELIERREAEARELANEPGPVAWDAYGGWAAGPRQAATGYFRVEKFKGKWWFVDPDGHLFWSHGIDCVRMLDFTPIEERAGWFADFPGASPDFREFLTRGHALKGHYGNRSPESFSFSGANLLRKYGPDWKEDYPRIVHQRLRSWGLNTIGNWSDDLTRRLRRTPYTDTVSSRGARNIEGSEGYWGQFPDVFDPSFKEALTRSMASRRNTSAGDPWCLGYFSDNEMSWGDDTSLALAALKSPANQPAKAELVADLRSKYTDIARLNAAWDANHDSWDALLQSRQAPDRERAKTDLIAFYTKAADRYFRTVRDEIKSAAPHQLYLGCRFAWVNDIAAQAAGRHCDVVSYNLYRRAVSDFTFPGGDKPLLIGEFHFGALDRGLFHPGLVPVADQARRSAAYEDYVLGAARHPQFVGTHWFQWQDEPTTGRVYDEENYQIGFVDVADTPYRETIAASREVARLLYGERLGRESTGTNQPAATDPPSGNPPPGTNAFSLADEFPAPRLRSMLVARADWRPFPRRLDRDGWNRLSDDARRGLIQRGEHALSEPIAALPATLYLAYARDGNRSRFEGPYFDRRRRLHQLVLAECAEGEGRFDDAIVNALWAICEESTWCLPAHVGAQRAGVGLPDIDEPIVDLFAAQTASSVAWTLYLLGPELDAVSSRVRPRAAAEVDRRILTPFLKRDFGWMGFHASGSSRPNNWNPWINGNVLTAALLLEPDDARRVALVHRVLSSLDRFLQPYPRDGSCDEGPGYWSRAGGSVLDNLDCLFSATSGALDVFGNPLIGEMGRFIDRVHIAADWYVDIGDCPARTGIDRDVVYRFGGRIHDAGLQALATHGATLEELLDDTGGIDLGRGLRTLADLGAILAKSNAKPAFQRDVWLGSEDMQMMVARDQAGSTEGLFVAAWGGHNAQSHNHNDVGNFIVFADGEPVFVDLGAPTYTAKTFSSHRYDIPAMQSGWHNLPTLHGVQQSAGRPFAARDVTYSETDAFAELQMDIAPAWPSEAGVKTWRRSVRLDRGQEVRITEAFELGESGSDTRLNLWTPLEPLEGPEGGLRLALKGAPDRVVEVLFNTEQLKVEWDATPLEDSRLAAVWGPRITHIRLSPRQSKPQDTWILRIRLKRK